MLGTSFRTTYSIVAEAPTLMQCQAMAHDSNAGISRREFETAAWGAANHKARELGWITQSLEMRTGAGSDAPQRVKDLQAPGPPRTTRILDWRKKSPAEAGLSNRRLIA